MCSTHYRYWLHNGIPEPRSFEEKFWERVDRSGGPDACHPWMRGRSPRGYGAVTWNDRSYRAHRVAWILTHGPIPPGMNVLHHCDNPPCCNAEDTDRHLFLGTIADNNADMRAKGRARGRSGQTHCVHGHEYTLENTTWMGGRRRCRACRREQALRWSSRQR